MKELDGFRNGMLSSKRIAERTGKEHKHVIRDIYNMIEQLEKDGPKMDHLDFQVFTDNRGYTQEILLNERLCLCLASGYSTVLRMAIIDDWVSIKRSQLGGFTPVTLPNRRELALLLIESEDRILELESEVKEKETKIEILTPKAETFEKFISTEGLYSNAEAGKMLGIGQNRLCQLFREWGVYNKKNVPYQRFIDEGCFQLKVSIVKMGDKEKQFVTTLVTPKGMDRLRKKHKAHEDEKKKQIAKEINGTLNLLS